MGITFIALIILQLIIGLLVRFAATRSREPLQKLEVDSAAAVDDTAEQAEDEEFVAVISAAIAMNMQLAGKDIIIRNIRRIKTFSLAWSKAGILDQMNSRF